jgi:hypothetical protein
MHRNTPPEVEQDYSADACATFLCGRRWPLSADYEPPFKQMPPAVKLEQGFLYGIKKRDDHKRCCDCWSYRMVSEGECGIGIQVLLMTGKSRMSPLYDVMATHAAHHRTPDVTPLTPSLRLTWQISVAFDNLPWTIANESGRNSRDISNCDAYSCRVSLQAILV